MEILIVDDGSSDGSLSLAKELAAANDEVRVFSQCNKGASAARNVGLANASGDYVLMQDVDDELPAGYFREAFCAIGRFEPDIVRCNYAVVINGQQEIHKIDQPYNERLDEKFIHDEVIPYMIGIKADERKTVACHCTAMIKRNLLVDHSVTYDEASPVYEDHKFLINALRYASSLVFLEDVGYVYVKHENSLVHSKINRVPFLLNNLSDYKEWFSAEYDFNEESKVKYDFGVLVELAVLMPLYRKQIDVHSALVDLYENEYMVHLASRVVSQPDGGDNLSRLIAHRKVRTAVKYTYYLYVKLRAHNLLKKILG